MSREYYQAIRLYHDDLAVAFGAGGIGFNRHVECRIADCIYVYLYVDGVHVQTQHVSIPERWWHGHWPSDETVRRYIRAHVDLGSARITDLEA